MLSLANNVELPVSRDLLIYHAIQISDAILQDQIEDPERPEYDGGISGDGRTVPTATRLEGLQAVLIFRLPTMKEVSILIPLCRADYPSCSVHKLLRENSSEDSPEQ